MNWWIRMMPRRVRRFIRMRALADRLAKKAAKSLHDATAEATGARQTEDSRRIWRRFATLHARHRRVLLELGREVR